jgi:hypothetical protein
MVHQRDINDCKDIKKPCHIKIEELDEVDDSAVVKKKGFLVKESKILKMWRSRWFILTSDFLYAFKGEDDQNQIPTEKIRLSDCSSVSVPVGTGKDHVFCVETPERTFLLRAASDFERDAWIAAIQDSCLSLFIDDGISKRLHKSDSLSKFSIPEDENEDSDLEELEESEDDADFAGKVGCDIWLKASALAISTPKSPVGLGLLLNLVADGLY